MPKYLRYQDYVIRDGRLVGEFDEMYRDHTDPWEQTTRERFASEKAVALNLISRLKAERGARVVVELGSGLGDFTARIAELGVHVIGIDISQTAVDKARARHPSIDFICGRFSYHEALRDLKPDIVVMADITWYVLDELPAFLSFFKRDLPQTWLIHLLMTYAPGIQRYGAKFFTDLDGIKRYFGLNYLESGLVHYDRGARSWFAGRAAALDA